MLDLDCISMCAVSQVAGAIVGCVGLKSVEDKYIGPSGEGESQATGTCHVADTEHDFLDCPYSAVDQSDHVRPWHTLHERRSTREL